MDVRRIIFIMLFFCVEFAEPMATDDKLRHTNKNENVVDTRQSPPKAIVDYSPLQPAINKNKEGKLNGAFKEEPFLI